MNILVDREIILSALSLPADPATVAGLETLAIMIEESEGWSSAEAAIYALATVRHETSATFLPVLETGEPEDFAEYEPMTPMGVFYGNRFEGDGFLFRRRGYVPIFGRYAYSKFGSVLRLPLIADPEIALEPEIAFRVLKEGMEQGLFTGRKIGDYVNTELANYVEARRVFNRLDKANVIAGYARAIAANEGVKIAEEHPA